MQNNIKTHTSRRFSQWSSNYDQSLLQNFVFKHSHSTFIKKIATIPQKKLRILDIGCGTGEFALTLAHSFQTFSITGIDISPGMIKEALAKNNRYNISFQVADAEHLPFDANSFDIVTSSHSFHHYPNQHQAVSEIHRVLKPHGKLMIIDGAREPIIGKLIFGLVIAKLEKNTYHILCSELNTLCKNIGFTNIEQKIIGKIIPRLFTVGTKPPPPITAQKPHTVLM